MFKIPNYSDAAFPDQAEPDSVDFDVLTAGFAVYGVKTGCAVSAQGTPDMTVAVAVGTVYVGGRPTAVTAGNVTITTADPTNARFDLITVDVNGAKAAVAGTAASNPVFPAIPASRVLLAAVYVPAGDTAINSNQIIDKRIMYNAILNGWYDMMDYGVVADGATDDAPAMQACFDACRLAGGGTVYSPPSPNAYIIGSQQGNQQYATIPKPGVSVGAKTLWRGGGPGNTIIKLKGGLASGFEMIMNWNNDTVVDTDIIVQDLSIDGNKAGVTHSDQYGAAIAFRKTKRCKYVNVEAHDTWVRGMVFDTGSYNTMRGCFSYDNREYGFILANEVKSVCIDCSAWGNPSGGGGPFGFFELAYSATGCVVVACKGYNSTGNNVGVQLKSPGPRNAIVGCVLEGGQYSVFSDNCHGTVVVANEFISPASYAIETYGDAGVYAQNHAYHCGEGLIRCRGADNDIGGNVVDEYATSGPGPGCVALYGGAALRNHVHNNLIRGGSLGYADGIKETAAGGNPDFNRVEHNDVDGLQSGYVPVTLIGANSTKHRNRGSELVSRSVQIPAEKLKAIAGAASSVLGSGVSAIPTRAYGPDALEEANLSFLLSSRYVQNLNCYIEWAPVDAGAGNVRWALDYLSIALGGLVGATSTEVKLTVAAPGVATARTRTTLATGLTVTAGQLVKFAIARYGDDVTYDTYAGIAHLLMVEFTWEEYQE